MRSHLEDENRPAAVDLGGVAFDPAFPGVDPGAVAVEKALHVFNRESGDLDPVPVVIDLGNIRLWLSEK